MRQREKVNPRPAFPSSWSLLALTSSSAFLSSKYCKSALGNSLNSFNSLTDPQRSCFQFPEVFFHTGEPSLLSPTSYRILICRPLPEGFLFVFIIRTNPRSQKTAKSHTLWPSLEEKYQLAATIAQGLLALLNVNWVHKALTSANIVMFHQHGSVKAVEFSKPQIMGFGVSRPDKPGDVTIDVRSLDTPWSVWQHPGVQAVPHRRYQCHHDIYSFGMILFEIGMWQDLHYYSLPDDNPVTFRRRVVNACHQKLAHYVGEVYRDVVLLCIDRDDIWEETEGDNNASVLELFSWDVVRVLKGCVKN